MFCLRMSTSGCFFCRSTRISPRAPQERVPVRWPFALRELPSESARWTGSSRQGVLLPAELLLRPQRLPQEGDAAIHAVPRPEGLSGCRDPLGGGQSAGAFTARNARAFQTLRRRPEDDRALAGLVVRALPPQPLLESRSRRLRAGDRGGRPSPVPPRSVPSHRRSPRRLEAAFVFPIADHHRGRLGGRSPAMMPVRAEDTPRPRGGSRLGWSGESPFHPIREEH